MRSNPASSKLPSALPVVSVLVVAMLHIHSVHIPLLINQMHRIINAYQVGICTDVDKSNLFFIIIRVAFV